MKSGVLLLLALVTTTALQSRSASTRHSIWTIAFGAILALPLMTAALPSWQVPLPGWTIQSTPSGPSARADQPAPAIAETPAAAIAADRSHLRATSSQRAGGA